MNTPSAPRRPSQRDPLLAVVVSGVPVFGYQREDEVAEALFVALAQELGYARPGELTARPSLSLRRTLPSPPRGRASPPPRPGSRPSSPRPPRAGRRSPR